MKALMIAAAAALTPPSVPLKGELQAAIWADLQLNAMIGSGNWLAALWYNAPLGDGQNLHVADLLCGKHHAGQRCLFTLLRDGGPSMVLGQAAPDKLVCDARFTHRRDGWAVVHTPPRGHGHSQTTMECKV